MPVTTSRHNGHEALSYSPLADLPPHLADTVLDALAIHGIAAYAGPAMRHNWPSVPQPWMTAPVDRVFVDSQAQDLAQEVLHQHLQTCRLVPSGADNQQQAEAASADGQDHQAWEQVLTSFHLPSFTESQAGAHPGDLRYGSAPDQQGTTHDGADADNSTSSSPAATEHEPGHTPVHAHGLTTAHTQAFHQDQQRAVGESGRLVRALDPTQPHRNKHDSADASACAAPPAPRRFNRVTVLGWALLLASPVLLLIAAAFSWDLGGWMGAVGATCFVAGLVMVLTESPTQTQGCPEGQQEGQPAAQPGISDPGSHSLALNDLGNAATPC